MAGLKAVLFDNDGTLVDSRELLLASFHYAGPAVLGRQLSDEEYLQKVGQPLAVQVKDYADDPVLQERFCEAYRAHNKTVHDKMIKAFPGTVEALAELASAGLKLGVVTSKRHALPGAGSRWWAPRRIWIAAWAGTISNVRSPIPSRWSAVASCWGSIPASACTSATPRSTCNPVTRQVRAPRQ